LRPPWYEGASALVIGLARSGKAACELLKRHGCAVVGSDSRTGGEFSRSLDDLRKSGVAISLGSQEESLLEGVDLVVLSPGVHPGMPLIAAALRKGIPVIGELELAFHAAAAPIVAVTGTNGKSTCVEMLGEIFRAAGNEVAVAGNVGLALSEVAETVPTSGVLVVEVSSFQLERTSRFRPHVAVLLNVTQDHLDRHLAMEDYLSMKLRIFANQRDQDVAVLNGDQPELAAAAASAPVKRRMTFSLRGPVDSGVFADGGRVICRWEGSETVLFPADSLRVPGPHNLSNAMAAAAAAVAMSASAAAVSKGLSRFAGLEHRMETAAELDGVVFVNDSKATNPDSLRRALLASPGKVVLIAGGRDKGMSFDELAELVARKARAVLLIGEAAGRMREAWKGSAPSIAPSLADAVERAWSLAEEGDWVLLSPGCASFDMFDDFEDRGRKFKEIVGALARRRGTVER
jgi:UDP-N-acetylmuramoylalanine--D-glutamate ligase